jgi:diguanylate cyclase (GGDEF)-like protein/PAS domain S-box-containing protein
MTPIWHALATNLAVAALFFALWALAQPLLEDQRRPARHLALGVSMGIGAVTSMLLSVELQPGMFVDLRSSMIAVAGFFGGPVAALVAGAMAALYRVSVGGSGAVAGLTVIGLAALIGIAGSLLRRGKPVTAGGILALGAAVSIINFVAISSLPIAAEVVSRFGISLSLLAFVATVVAGLFIQVGSRLARDRVLLRAALTQAPDFHYLKDPASRFTAVNQSVTTFNGYARPADMIGKTDFDLTDAERAERLYAKEQEIMRTGRPQLDLEERLVDDEGTEQWFSTSKVPLRDADGEIIGLAGVTRDITARRRLEAELTDSRNLLSYAVSEMSDGLAMFDRAGHLVYCNDRYRSMFPLTSEERRLGSNIRDILKAVVEKGEQLNLGDPDKWINDVITSMQVNGEEQVSLLDGRWLQVRTRPTLDGASLVVVSDVTSMKKAEAELMTLTGQLQVLASTDALTGLMNRRAFDAAIGEEVERSERNRRPLSLVLCDVDRFKTYNDDYGHQAGDECLRAVARCLKGALLRHDDMAVRYGGEEFAALLPNTDEDSANIIAERVRSSLFDLGLQHTRSEHGVVTVSAGISTYPGRARRRSAEQLVARADVALYDAKAAGRNRVTGWRPTPEARRARLSG